MRSVVMSVGAGGRLSSSAKSVSKILADPGFVLSYTEGVDPEPDPVVVAQLVAADGLIRRRGVGGWIVPVGVLVECLVQIC